MPRDGDDPGEFFLTPFFAEVVAHARTVIPIGSECLVVSCFSDKAALDGG